MFKHYECFTTLNFVLGIFSVSGAQYLSRLEIQWLMFRSGSSSREEITRDVCWSLVKWILGHIQWNEIRNPSIGFLSLVHWYAYNLRVTRVSYLSDFKKKSVPRESVILICLLSTKIIQWMITPSVLDHRAKSANLAQSKLFRPNNCFGDMKDIWQSLVRLMPFYFPVMFFTMMTWNLLRDHGKKIRISLEFLDN